MTPSAVGLCRRGRFRSAAPRYLGAAGVCAGAAIAAGVMWGVPVAAADDGAGAADRPASSASSASSASNQGATRAGGAQRRPAGVAPRQRASGPARVSSVAQPARRVRSTAALAHPTGRSATPWPPNPHPFFTLLFSDGTAAHPNAGLLVGNGFSFDAVTCVGNDPCAGGMAGLLYGNGGSGFNGGNGGSAALFGNGGSGGDAPRALPGVSGGNGGSAGFFVGNGGNGGEASTGARGGNGGRAGLLFGVGGDGGTAGSGAVQCSQGQATCAVVTAGGAGGAAGAGGLLGRAGVPGAAPLPQDSRLFVGYLATYNNQVRPDGGGLVYPDEDDPSKPYAIPGTVVAGVQLPAGVALSRFGYPGGSYLSTDASYFAQLALPPSSSVEPYFEYVLADPAKLPVGFQIEQSQVAPWFGQPGGGMQFRITGPDGRDAPVQALLTAGFLARSG